LSTFVGEPVHGLTQTGGGAKYSDTFAKDRNFHYAEKLLL